jgi:hypothetical protein
MCRQVYRSMWTNLWKRHSAHPCAQISECLRVFRPLVLARSELFLPQSTTLPAEDTGGLLLGPSFPVVSSSCPCLFRIKTEVHILIFWSLEHVFWVTGSTVNWFAYRRFERYGCGLTTVCTCDFEHSFLERVNHLYWCWACCKYEKWNKTMLG